MKSLRRLFKRPSVLLIRSILIPLTVIHVLITVYAVIVAGRAANSIAFDRVQGIAQATAMQDHPSQAALERMAARLGADRIWIVSATGRILASNREGEVNAPIDPVWWQDLPEAEREFRQRRDWGDQAFVQIAYHDVEAGVWSMIIADVRSPLVSATARVLAILVFSLSIWMLLAGSIAIVIQRRLGKGLDISDLMARKALAGEPVSTASLARTKASISSFGPGGRLLALVERMQERASRANEAESRFHLAVELLPGLAYLASYDGVLLWAAQPLRELMPEGQWIGQPIAGILPHLPLERVHRAAQQAGGRGVTFDQLPVREESPGSPAMVASIRSVVFRGTPAYLAHLETVNDAGLATRIPFSSRPETEVLEYLLDETSEAIIAFDGAARTIVWNRVVEGLTQTSRSEASDVRKAIEAITPDAEGVEAFARWMDGEPQLEPLVLDSPAQDSAGQQIRWTARDIILRGRIAGGALFGALLESGSGGVAEASPTHTEAPHKAPAPPASEPEVESVPESEIEARCESEPIEGDNAAEDVQSQTPSKQSAAQALQKKTRKPRKKTAQTSAPH